MCRRQTPGRERGREGERGRERERGGDSGRYIQGEEEGERGTGREREKEGGGVREAFVGVILPTMHMCMRTNTVYTIAKYENENTTV